MVGRIFPSLKYTVVEFSRKIDNERYEVWPVYDHEPTSGIGWIHRGEPCSYREARRRVSILNKYPRIRATKLKAAKKQVEHETA